MEFFKSMLAFISSKKELTEFDHVARESCEYKKSLLMQYTVDQNSLGFKYDHIIHGDYVDQNVFWDSNNEILAVFDFEKAQMAPRMFEVFRAMFLSFYSGHDPEKDLQTVTLFLKEYHSHYPISRDECVRGFELFYGKCIHTLWIEQQHYIHNQTRSDHFLRIDLDRLKSLTLHKQLILETLLKVVV
jgi:Ser/Thr protein kinase RdoA (MazF antagonist)